MPMRLNLIPIPWTARYKNAVEDEKNALFWELVAERKTKGALYDHSTKENYIEDSAYIQRFYDEIVPDELSAYYAPLVKEREDQRQHATNPWLDYWRAALVLSDLDKLYVKEHIRSRWHGTSSVDWAVLDSGRIPVPVPAAAVKDREWNKLLDLGYVRGSSRLNVLILIGREFPDWKQPGQKRGDVILAVPVQLTPDAGTLHPFPDGSLLINSKNLANDSREARKPVLGELEEHAITKRTVSVIKVPGDHKSAYCAPWNRGQLNPTLPGAAAAAVIATQIQQAYLKNGIANAAATAADIIRQNAVINAINDTSRIIGQKTNDPASMMLAVGRAQATAQTNAAWINNGKIAEQALPVVRNVVEALAYAMFPIVVLLLFLTSGRETMIALKNYIAVLIWIQLWPPLYAILNYMASIYAASELSAAANVGGGLKALSLLTSSSIYSNAISSEAVVGYLTISIPFIAWAALKRMENFGSVVVGGLSTLQSAITGSTGSSAVGNVNMGNVAMDQMQLAPNRTSAFMSSMQSDITGNTVTSNVLNGRTAVSLLRNQGFTSRVVSMRVSEQDVTEANRQVDSARSEAISANTERSAVLADALTKGIAKYRSSRSSGGTSSSSFEEAGENLSRLDQITKGVAEKTGLSQSQVAQIAFGAAGHVGASTPLAGAEIKTNAGKTYQSALSGEQQKVLGSMTAEQIAAFKQFGDRISRDASFVNAIGTDSKEAKDMSARLATATSRSERVDTTLAQRTAFAERLSSARERGETISIDIAQDPHNVEMFMRYAKQYGGNSAAAFAMFEAELARQGLRPNRIFSDGTALPTSFEDIRAQYDQNTTDPRLNTDTAAINREHRKQVLRFDTSVPSTAGSTKPSEIRDDIQAHGVEIRKQTGSTNQEFDTEAEIAKTPDGTLASKKSLLKQTGKQVAQDAGATFDIAKDAVKDLLNKK